MLYACACRETKRQQLSALSYFLMARSASAGQIKHKQGSWSSLLRVSEAVRMWFLALFALFPNSKAQYRLTSLQLLFIFRLLARAAGKW